MEGERRRGRERRERNRDRDREILRTWDAFSPGKVVLSAGKDPESHNGPFRRRGIVHIEASMSTT
jgi:hypothetical protein